MWKARWKPWVATLVTGDPQDLSGLDLSLADVLTLEDPDGTILPGADALPDTIGY